VCPDCQRQADERAAATGRDVSAPELTLAMTLGPGQVRELDVLAAAERDLGEFGSAGLAAHGHGSSGGDDDDGE
jgi:hypothetical protein